MTSDASRSEGDPTVTKPSNEVPGSSSHSRAYRVAIIACVISVLSLGYAAVTTFELLILKIRIAFAEEQIMFFEDFAIKYRTERPDLSSKVRFEQIAMYYVSGTKQLEGSNLDSAVESARRIALQCVANEGTMIAGEDNAAEPLPAVGEK